MIFLWCCLAWQHARAEILEGRVVKVIDGDTVEVTDSNRRRFRVRLSWSDAPEKAQPHGINATRNLRALVYRKPVSVDWYKKDEYRRLIGQLWVAPANTCPNASATCKRTLDAALAQISAGMGWHYRHYAHEQTVEDRERYAQAEEQARGRHAGLWGARRKPIPPWEWRHSHH
ncbi:MAG: nuclease [Betaproteobacteria bacterium]|nr:nuclease [Betaproteobacteria bacterium]